MLFTMNSCGDKLDLDKTLKFSTLTVEQQKQSIEQSGIDFVNKMDGLKDTKAMLAMQSMTGKMNSNSAYAPAFNQLQSSLLRNDVKTLEKFEKQMRVASGTGEEIWGEWTWSISAGEFELTNELTNKAILHFPATETSKTNNAVLTITFADSKVKMPDTDPVQYMPSSISVVLKVDGSTALKADFTASYRSDATPTKVKQTLEIDKYSWSVELSNDAEDVSAKYAVKYGSETLVKIELEASGNLTIDGFEKSNGPEDVFVSGAIYFQIMNVACLGGVKDFEAFNEQMNALTDTDDRSYADKKVAVINKHLIVYGYFVDKKQKFADVEFYVVESNVIDDSNYNEATNEFGTKTVYYLQPRFSLNDGSKTEIETYFESGFEELIDMLSKYEY